MNGHGSVPSDRPREAPEGFWDVWVDHRAYLFGLSLRWMRGNHADAEDALSAVSLRAMLHFRDVSAAIRNERAWLRRLLHNACMDVYRRRRSARDLVVAFGEEEAGEPPAEAGDLSPEAALLQRERFGEIEALVDGLPPSWRHALLARLVGGRSYRDIAAEAGTTQANIRKRVQLARQTLRDRLAGPGTAGAPVHRRRRRPS